MATIRETNNGLSMQRVKNGGCVVWVEEYGHPAIDG